MNKLPTQFQTLANVLSAIQADDNLSTSRKKSIATYFRVYARVQNKALEAIAADPKAIRKFCKSFLPASAGFSRAHWGNVISSMTFAFFHVGLISLPGRSKAPLCPAWQTLYGRANRKEFRAGLSRLIRFCSTRGIKPSEVDDSTLNEFLRVLLEESLAKEPARLHRRAIIMWNRAVSMIEGWPQKLLVVPDNKYRWTFDWDTFPENLRSQVDTYFDDRANPDFLVDKWANRPLAEATIQGDRYKLLCFCSALVKTGSPPETLTDLNVLLKMENVLRGLRFLHDHYGKDKVDPREKTKTVYRIAQILHVIGRDFLKLDDDHQNELKKIGRKLTPPKAGMTDKNRKRLRQLDDPRNVRRLLDLPACLVRKAKRLDQGRRNDALLVQLALAIDILTVAPLRLGNLARLTLDKHIQRSRPGRNGVVHLVIDAQEVKNNQALEFELPPETVNLLRLYLEEYRPRLTTSDNLWLFPGRGNSFKVPAALGKQISDTVAKEIGLEIHPHLFRHAMAKLFLDQNPGQYEVVRQVLGHSAMNTTVSFYAGGEGVSAARHFDRTILQLRDRSLTNLDGGL